VSVTVRAPAKVNLHLGVGQLRSDGFHSLVSVFQAVSLYDEITVDHADDLGVAIVGDDYDDIPTDTSNLAMRAAIALGQHVGRRPAVRITIHKGIPVAGGMAGGSADAAATLLACDALWQTGVDPRILHDIAARLGSDVPFCLLGGTALGGGRGEQLTQVLVRGTYHWVFALADTGLPTPLVYGELDRMRSEGPWPESSSPRELIAALGAGDPRRLGTLLHNDLQRAALRLRPGLRRTLEAGRDAHALGAIICGSGPTCAFLTQGEAEAVELVAALAGSGTCRTVRRAHGPVPGARVVA
jgi:4-diphosphocytidyl-2-C-methyl-D-erythritol kinase